MENGISLDVLFMKMGRSMKGSICKIVCMGLEFDTIPVGKRLEDTGRTENLLNSLIDYSSLIKFSILNSL